MARVAVAPTGLPGGNVDGADAAVTLTTGDLTNDHVVNAALPGDLVCAWSINGTASTTDLFAYANQYGRPTTPAAELSDSGSPALGRLVVYYAKDLEGLVNAAGGIEFNVTQAHRVFAIRTNGET